MRHFKFRAWDKDLQQMSTPDDLTVENVAGVPPACFNLRQGASYLGLELALGFDGQSDGNIELQQFTGLTDRNGREIYEGDVLFDPQDWIGPVVFDDGGFVAKWDEYCVECLSQEFMNDCVVIGHIYESDDLIQERIRVLNDSNKTYS